MVALATIGFTEGVTTTQSMVAMEMTQFTEEIMLTSYMVGMEMMRYMQAVEMGTTRCMAKQGMII